MRQLGKLASHTCASSFPEHDKRFRELLRGGIESFVESLFIAQGRGFLELPAVSSDDIGTDSREGCRYPERDRLYRRVDNSAENVRDCDDVIYSLPTTTTFFVQSTKLCAYLSCVCLDCLRKMEGGRNRSQDARGVVNMATCFGRLLLIVV